MTINLTGEALSAAQVRLLSGQLLARDVPLCNMAMACTLEDAAIDEGRVVQSWADIAGAIDALGIGLTVDENGVTQSTGHSPPEMQLIDFSSDNAALQRARQWTQADVSTALGPDGPLGRVAMIKLAPKHWIFYCNLHHVICDATSFALIWQRLAQRYQQLSVQPTVAYAANPEAASFLSFVRDSEQARQRRATDKPDYIGQLRDIVSSAPFGRRPGPSDTGSARVSEPLNAQRLAQLGELASHPQARAFGQGIGHCSVLLTLLVTLLYRIGGGTTQTIGLPLPQRQHPGHRETVGLLVEVLPVQVDVDEHASFLSLLQQSRSALLSLLKDARAGDSALLDSPAIPALLNYINAPMGDFGVLPAQVEWLHSGHIDHQHLIRLQVQDWAGDGNITLAFDFNNAVFDEPQRRASIDAFWALFDAMASDIDHRVEAVTIAAPRQLSGAAISVSKIAQPTVWSRIARNCSLFTEATALIENGQACSYSQMGGNANRIAMMLAARGVGRGARVAVHLHRDIRLPQVLLGILACRAAYVPIDSAQPASRVNAILTDARPRVLITSEHLNTEYTLTEGVESVDVLLVDEIFDELSTDEYAKALPLDPPDPADLAYLIYTSGSTGVPKGVAITHASLASYCNWAASFYAADQAVNMPLFTAIGFDLTVTSLFLPLMTGGTLHVYSELTYPGMEALNAVLREDLVDIVKLTPAHLSGLTSDQCMQTSRLSAMIVGGENLPVTLAARIDRYFESKLKIHNEYGPTEATVGCVLHTFDAREDTTGAVPIGRPVANSVLRVLNAAGEDVLPGCSGELFVGGSSLATGYWEEVDLTRSRFVELPPHGARFYGTGDLVREDKHGVLHCLGRIDSQFKLRGHRIEPAEIESVALQHPHVDACVAVLIDAQQSSFAPDEKCTQCGLSSRVPGALLDDTGVCVQCRNFAQYRERVESYFRSSAELEQLAGKMKASGNATYDCIMLLSGGKDSTYALGQLVDMGLKVLAFTLDNGFISASAKGNISRVCSELGVDHRYGVTPSMNAIFLDSLQKHANVCNGCFKTIYTMALQLATELEINCIVTGLSRGQFFETRLSEDWFLAPDYRADAMDEAIVAARRVYHRIEDAVSCALDTRFLHNDDVFERIQVVDFYRYCDVNLDEIYRYLDQRLPWVRPADTGRSTNCLINDAGIYVHKHERGFHNYAHPYSWDVRLGHKQRDEALEELDDEIDEIEVLAQLQQIGYRLSEKPSQQIVLYFVSRYDLAQSDLRRWMAGRLPEWMIPSQLVAIPELPLNLNGKIDLHRLPAIGLSAVHSHGVPRAFAEQMQASSQHGVADELMPQTELERLLHRIWCRHLNLASIGVDENFFALGGDSLMAIRITSELNRGGYRYRPADIFEKQSIAQLAQVDFDGRNDASVLARTDTQGSDDNKPAAFSSLKGGQLDALKRALNKGRER